MTEIFVCILCELGPDLIFIKDQLSLCAANGADYIRPGENGHEVTMAMRTNALVIALIASVLFFQSQNHSLSQLGNPIG